MLQPSETYATNLDFREARVWYALLVAAGKEQQAADWLKRSRVYSYWPNYTKQVAINAVINKRRRRQSRLSAVIPGHLFIAERAGGPDPWDVVHETPGVYSYIRDGKGRAAVMPEADIETIRRIEGGLNIPPPIKVAHRFKGGDKVRFVDDLLGRWPFGRVMKLADDSRISVEVPMLGRVVPIWVYPHQIEAM